MKKTLQQEVIEEIRKNKHKSPEERNLAISILLSKKGVEYKENSLKGTINPEFMDFGDNHSSW